MEEQQPNHMSEPIVKVVNEGSVEQAMTVTMMMMMMMMTMISCLVEKEDPTFCLHLLSFFSISVISIVTSVTPIPTPLHMPVVSPFLTRCELADCKECPVSRTSVPFSAAVSMTEDVWTLLDIEEKSLVTAASLLAIHT